MADEARQERPWPPECKCGYTCGLIFCLRRLADQESAWWCSKCLFDEIERLRAELLRSQRYNDVFFEQCNKGGEAYGQGLDRAENPYEIETAAYEHWDIGWLAEWGDEHYRATETTEGRP